MDDIRKKEGEMRRILKHALIAVSAAVLAVSCDYREFSYIIYDTCDIWVEVDWTKFTEEEPTGMSVYCYPRDHSHEPYLYRSNDITGVMVHLPVGTYDILVFNQSIDEFGSMRFEGMEDYSTACAVLEEKKTKWKVKTAEDESVKYEPEWLGVDTEEGLEVTQSMVEQTWSIRPLTAAYTRASSSRSDAVKVVTLHPVNLVYSANIYIRVYGINNLRMGRGSISGMAEEVNLSTGRRSTSTVTHALETWTVTTDAYDVTRGYFYTTFRCFGLPESGTGKASSNLPPEASVLDITYLLRDNETECDYSYKIGDRIECHDDILELDLYIGKDGYDPQAPTYEGDPDRPVILPEVKTKESGFTATIDDWGDISTIPVPVL